MADRPYPGSDEALDAGCLCPRMDNRYGHGRRHDATTGEPLFVIAGGCPLHCPPASARHAGPGTHPNTEGGSRG